MLSLFTSQLLCRYTIFAQTRCDHLGAVVEHSSITILRSTTHYLTPSASFSLQHGLLGQKEDSQVCTYHRQISFTSTRPLSEFKAVISGGCAEADVLDICFLPLPPFFFLTGSGDGMSSSSCMSAWTSLASTSLKQSEKVKKDMCDVRVYPCN